MTCRQFAGRGRWCLVVNVGACRSVGLESGSVRRAADLDEEIPELGFVVSVDRGKLETVGVVFNPADDRGFDRDGRAFDGDLEDQMILLPKGERGDLSVELLTEVGADVVVVLHEDP